MTTKKAKALDVSLWDGRLFEGAVADVAAEVDTLELNAAHGFIGTAKSFFKGVRAGCDAEDAPTRWCAERLH
jgi:hypothetical protein